MKKRKTNLVKKVSLFIFLILLVLTGGAIIGYQYLQSVLQAKISSCQLENRNYKEVIEFEYVNNWIVVKAKVAGCDEELPFIFDTGAQTVFLDSLLQKIGASHYDRLSFDGNSDTVSHAFNNELITLHNLELNGLRFTDIGAITASNEKWEMLNCISAYGIIGCNMIKHCNYQIDYQKKQIIITDQLEELPNYQSIQWVDYTSLETQESPVIAAVINDSVVVNLLFDTGMSGSLTLKSSRLYSGLVNNPMVESIGYTAVPTLYIRGEKKEVYHGLKFKASTFQIGELLSEDLCIHVKEGGRSSFDGILGNSFFENFIITLDFKNKKIGFIRNGKKQELKTTYGLSYTVSKSKMYISRVYDGFDPEIQGVEAGDEVHSINGIKISELTQANCCDIYRNEYSLHQPEDSLLSLEIIKNNSISSYQIRKQRIF